MNIAIKSYVLYNSPLKTKREKVILIVILLFVFILAVMSRRALGIDTLLKTYAWMGYSIFGCVATYLIVTYLDRKRAIK